MALFSREKPVEKKCPNCNAIIREGDMFCVSCGHKLIGDKELPRGRGRPPSQMQPSVKLPTREEEKELQDLHQQVKNIGEQLNFLLETLTIQKQMQERINEYLDAYQKEAQNVR